ncbi:MAG: MotA/TolQ/ExbB proton channel family protein [Pseudomonadota bacterium]
MDQVVGKLVAMFDLGGPVVAALLVVSVVTLAVLLYKLWQFAAAHVGRHQALRAAVAAWDAGDRPRAREALARSGSYLAPLVEGAFDGQNQVRLQAMAEERFVQLERGFRYLDSVAQLAPLLGLFGTVLGMIEAFQSLQAAGAQVDPSILAGGIWVALLTTAVGLVVAMPTALALAWFEGRMERERVVADALILTAVAPSEVQHSRETGADVVHARV